MPVAVSAHGIWTQLLQAAGLGRGERRVRGAEVDAART